MAIYGTTVAQEYSAKVLKVFFSRSFFDDVTNKDYFTPGDSNPRTTKSIKSRFQRYNIPTLYSNGWQNYTGSDLTYTNIVESVAILTIDQMRALSDNISDLAVFKSQVKEPQSTIVTQAGERLKVLMGQFVCSLENKAGAGNWLGTSYTTGTVTVTTGTGAVTGVGTTFTAGMVGKPFRALGHTKWFRVKTFSSTTAIVIEDDIDDEASVYTGGTITAGATYEIQNNALVAVTDANIAKQIARASQMLTDKEIPESDRWMVLPAEAKAPLLTAAQFNRDIEKVYDETVVKGRVAKAYGFDIYIVPNDRIQGNNVSGFRAMFGHKSAITAGYGFIDPIKLVDPESNFGTKIKGLFGYGAKVADERKKALGVLHATFNLS